MGPVIPFIAASITAAIGGGTLTYAVVSAGLYYAAGRFLYNLLAPDQPAPPVVPLSTRKQYIVESSPPTRIVYGEAELAPVILADFTHGPHKYCMLGALTPHALNSEILGIRVDEQEFFGQAGEIRALNRDGHFIAPWNNGTGAVSELRKQTNENAKEGDRNVIGLAYDFTAPVPGNFATTMARFEGGDQLLRARFGEDGTAYTPSQMEMKCSGLSWVYIGLPLSDKRRDINSNRPNVFGSVPTLTFRVKRDNSSLAVPIDPSTGNPFDITGLTRGNAALCAYDYLKRYTDYGEDILGVERLDFASFRAAVRLCEDHIDHNGKPLPLVANGVVDLATPPADIMEQFGFAMNGGVLTERKGIRYFLPGKDSNPVQTLTNDDIKDNSWGYVPEPEVNSRVSEMLVHYIDEDSVEQTVGFSFRPPPSSPGGPTPDIVNVTQEITSTLITDRQRAGNLARILLSRIWHGAAITFELVEPHTSLSVYDVVLVKGVGPLGVEEQFRIFNISRSEEGTVKISAIHEDRDIFKDSPLEEEGLNLLPPSRLPKIGVPETSETFRIKVGDFDFLAAGSTSSQTRDNIVHFKPAP